MTEANVDLSVVPESDVVFGRSRWRTRLGDVNLHADGVIDVEDSGASGNHIDARALAAALLAAANAAEAKPTPDPDCPSCECGGQLCPEHGTGKLQEYGK